MIKTTIPISFNLPDLDTTLVDEMVTPIGTITFGSTANDLVASYPNLFWLEADTEGVDHLCTMAIMGQPFPKLTTTGGSYHANEFTAVYADKQDGDRPWHPTTKPPRPIILP